MWGDPKKREGEGVGGEGEEGVRVLGMHPLLIFFLFFVAPPTCDVTVMRVEKQMKRIAEVEL